MKPVVVYVDDEPRNLATFEMQLDDSWVVKTFSNPLEALGSLEKISPCIIVSDQKMPGMTGVQYLELARKIHPHAIRIIITGYSDEELIIESVRTAQVFDYIRKPFNEGEIEARIKRAFDVFKLEESERNLRHELSKQNEELKRINTRLESETAEAVRLKAELESFIHPVILKLIEDKNVKFPFERDLIGITFDIVEGSKYHDTIIDGEPSSKHLIQLFSETLLGHGGCRETLPGDSVYGHFGLAGGEFDPAQSALAAAKEFRVKLRNFCEMHSLTIECGIALHTLKASKVLLHKAEVMTSNGPIIQKSVGTSSIEIDLLHRLEKVAHGLPGSNIVMSKVFYSSLKNSLGKTIQLGTYKLKGQKKSTEILIYPSDLVKDEHIESLKEKIKGEAVS